MRINKTDIRLTAADLLNSSNKGQLFTLFSNVIENRSTCFKLSTAVITNRNKGINTTFDLRKVIEKNFRYFNMEKFLSKIFLALRIVVNRERENIISLLNSLGEITSIGATILFLTFNSFETRLLKNFLRDNKDQFKIEYKIKSNKSLGKIREIADITKVKKLC